VSQGRYERDRLLETLARANADLRGMLDAGLVAEGQVAAAAPAPDRGLDVSLVNNFESAGTPGVEPAGVYAFGDGASSFSAGWNFETPLAGQSDLRFDFELLRQPGAYDEWVNLGFATVDGAEVDVRSRSRLVVTLAADRTRNVRIRLASAAYEDGFGGIWTEFGRDVSVGPAPTTVSLPLDGFAYPDWARAAWTAEQGWTTSDAVALASVRSRFTGLIFAPSGTFDTAGELTGARESGYLQIDDIRIE
jgi:hypothetical protein